MLEHNISYNAARCRIDPEFHEKQKEYKRLYAAKQKQEKEPKKERIDTKAYQIRTLMSEQGISQQAAKCRLDPEYHEKHKEYQRNYVAKRYQEDEQFRQKVKERARLYQAKPSAIENDSGIK
jgi:hypothetical protein